MFYWFSSWSLSAASWMNSLNASHVIEHHFTSYSQHLLLTLKTIPLKFMSLTHLLFNEDIIHKSEARVMYYDVLWHDGIKRVTITEAAFISSEWHVITQTVLCCLHLLSDITSYNKPITSKTTPNTQWKASDIIWEKFLLVSKAFPTEVTSRWAEYNLHFKLRFESFMLLLVFMSFSILHLIKCLSVSDRSKVLNKRTSNAKPGG